MIDCPKCKIAIDNDSFFCDQCGTELKECPRCKYIGKGNRCTQCGTVLVPRKDIGKTTDPVDTSGQNTNSAPDPKPVTPSPSNSNEANNLNTETTIRNVEPAPSLKKLFLKSNIGIIIHAENGAVVGRKNGPYSQMLAGQGYVSGTHARLDYNAQGYWTITDLGSTNGTMQNGSKLVPMQAYRINQNDNITIANISFTAELS